jgi:alkanesulfonate monooxygenase
MSTNIRVFSTCPASNLVEGPYQQAMREAARLSEQAGCEGMLVYTDNGLLDPWLVAQLILECTESIAPLVAVQPIYMHPYSVAKMVTTLAALHGRKTCLNLVAGGFKNDLLALDDQTPHDRRYDRVVEYTTILMALLRGETLTLEGEFYRVKNLKLTPPLKPELLPTVTLSGSSDAGAAAASRLGAIAVEYPKPVSDYEKNPITNTGPAERGIRIGIIARDDPDEAWAVARQRFPEDRKGKLKHVLAMKISDSSWHHELSRIGAAERGEDDPYWLVPFEHYKTFCPYLVGSYERVSREVSRYFQAGYGTVILDVPASMDEMKHIGEVLRRAESRCAS